MIFTLLSQGSKSLEYLTLLNKWHNFEKVNPYGSLLYFKFDNQMNKSGSYIVKLVLISFVVILSGTCNKPENKPVDNNPCDPGSPGGRILCFVDSPSNGAIVSPMSLTIKWRTVENSTSSLYLGTNIDSLQCISQQSEQSFVLKNLDPNTTFYWYVSVKKRCYSYSSAIYSFTTAPDSFLP